MTKNDRTPKKGLVLRNGNRLSHGQLFILGSKSANGTPHAACRYYRSGSEIDQMAKGAIKGTSARDLAEHDEGYSANGEGEYSRRSASPPNIALSTGRRTSGRLIRENQHALRKLEQHARIENDPIRKAKIRKNIAIKSSFLAKLKGQYEHQPSTTATGSAEDRAKPGSRSRKNSECWDWSEVETFPGEDDI